MKIQYLGTAAAEGIPALFCRCPVCEDARKKGGKHVRTRSQAIINDDLLVDFPADTYMHFLNSGIDTHKIKSCLITHNHEDHIYPADFEYIRKGYGDYKTKTGWNFTVYGSRAIGKAMELYLLRAAQVEEVLKYKTVFENETYDIDGYKVTPLKAIHSPVSDPLIYLIEKDGKAILYGNDTHYFHDDVWKYLKENKVHLNLVSMDCTAGNVPKMGYIGHGCLNDNIKIKEEMLKLGIADDKTVFVSNHFSHNGDDVEYDKFKAIAEKHRILTSYDGMVIEI